MKIKETEVNPNDFPIYIFHLGKNYRAQEFFGAHEVGKEEFVFRVWAPHASSVRVVGDFNGWDENASINIPKETIQDMFYLSSSLGANLAVFANNIYAGPFTLTTGAHLTISTQNVGLSEINDVSSDNMSFRVSPFIEIPFFEGMFMSRLSIDFMKFEKMHTSIKFSLGYKTKL